MTIIVNFDENERVIRSMSDEQGISKAHDELLGKLIQEACVKYNEAINSEAELDLCDYDDEADLWDELDDLEISDDEDEIDNSASDYSMLDFLCDLRDLVKELDI